MTSKEVREILQVAEHEELFLAILSRELSWEEAKNVKIYAPDYPEGISATNALKIFVREALLENNEPATDKNIKRIEATVKKTITSHLEERTETILLECEAGYIDVSEMKVLESKWQIKCIIPFAEYYKRDEYSFKEDENGNPYMDLDMEPFEKFVEDYENGKFN